MRARASVLLVPVAFALVLLSFCGLLQAAVPSDSGPPAQRLPKTVVPVSYDLTLHPDIDHLTFTGEVSIAVNVSLPVTTFVLNAVDLVFDEATLDESRKADVAVDATLEQARLRFTDSVPRGAHTLRIRYHGTIVQSTLGLFAMDYETASGKRRTLATNFEPASERMLMPSWDEPGFKALWRLTVDAPADRMAISNMPIETETPLANGMKRVRFVRSPKMSTYLFFLAIGDYERIAERVDGVEVGVVVNKGEADRGRYALNEATRLVHYYNDYFGVHYPLPKLDLVAAPGEIQGGSMENWGAIFYSQKHLLFDPKNSTEADRHEVFLVVSHEMAHQWFGDLVTMAWWDNLWLNEGFARWMQTKAADDLNPEWQTGLVASSIVEQGMRLDAKPSTHAVEQPVASAAEAELAFDEITYDKGATVIGMIENYVGADRFRAGVRRYMRAHAFGNTLSNDLWTAVQAAAGKPVQAIAADFTRRPGLPLVTVGVGSGTLGNLALVQSRFVEGHVAGEAETPTPPWHLPLTVKPQSGAPVSRVLADERTGMAVAGQAPLIVNAGRKSYTRVRYAPVLFEGAVQHFGALAPADQIGLVQDAWALGESQYAPITHVPALVIATPFDANPIVWLDITKVLVSVDRLYTGLPGRDAFRAWARSRLNPVGARVGWDQANTEASGVGVLRETLLSALSRFDDVEVIAEARRRDAAATADAASQSPAAQRIALEIVARHADANVFNTLLDRLHATHDPLAKADLLDALTQVADPLLAQRLLDVIIGPDVPAGTMPDWAFTIAQQHPDLTWRFLVSHVDAPGFQLDRSTRMVLMPWIPAMSSDLNRVEELKSYAAEHLPPAAAREVMASVAQIGLNARVREMELPLLDAWLKANAN